MASGYDRREGVQDPNQTAGKVTDAGSLPLGQVMSPRHSDFSQVGGVEQDIASVLSKAGPLLNDYVEAKTPEWRLDGILAQQQGKTQEEIAATGNRYTVQGFQGMQAVTALDTMYGARKAALTSGDQELDPTAYREKLVKDFSQLTSGIKDPYVKRLVASHAESSSPALLEDQMKAHTVWKENQTFSAFQGQLGVKAGLAKDSPKDRAELDDMIMHADKLSGLSADRTKEALANVAHIGMKSDNNTVLKLLQGEHQVPAGVTQNQSVESIIDFTIDQVEGNGEAKRDNNGHMVKFGINGGANNLTDEQVSKLTRAQAIQIYKDKYWTANGVGNLPASMQAVAFDAYVQHGPSAKSMIDKAGNNPIQLADLRMQEAGRLEDSGKGKYANFRTIEQNRLRKLAASPASTPVQGGIEPNDLASSLLAKGFKAQDVEQLVQDQKEYAARKVATYDINRLNNEDMLRQMMLSTGNSQAVYGKIQSLMKDNDYSAEWGNQMANQAQAQKIQFDKDYQEKVVRNQAAASNLIETLPKTEAQKAYAEGRESDLAIVKNNLQTGAYNDLAKQAGTSPEQIAKQDVQQRHFQRLVANRGVDTVVAKELQQGIRGAMLNKGNIFKDDGKSLTYSGEQVVNSFGSLYALRAMSGNDSGYISKFFDGDEKAELLWNQVLTRDKTGKNIPAALSNALAFQNLPDGIKISQVETNPKSMATMIKSEIETRLDPSWWSAHVWGNVGAPTSDHTVTINDNEMKRYLDNPVLTQIIKNEADGYKIKHYPEAQDAEAVEFAFSQFEKRGVFVGGSVFQVPDSTTPGKVFNLENTPNPIQSINDAVANYMRNFGPELFGDNWNDMQFTERSISNINKEYGVIAGPVQFEAIGNMKQNIMDAWRGFPEASYKLDATRNMLLITPWLNKEHTVPGTTVAVPAKDIGTFHKQSMQPNFLQKAIKSGIGSFSNAGPAMLDSSNLEN